MADYDMDYGGYGNYGGGADGGYADYNSEGGFMQSSQQSNSSPRSQSKSFKDKLDTISPVTVKQLKAQTESFERVKLVGRIVSVSKKSVQTTFCLNDTTGNIDCILWNSTDQISSLPHPSNEVKENDYVRIVGQTKSFNETLTVNIFSIRPVTSHNEVLHHYLSCIATKLPSYGSYGMHNLEGGNRSASTGNTDSAVGRLSALEEKICQVLKEESDHDVGLSEIDVCYKVCSNGGEKEQNVKNAIRRLVQIGLIFNTIDEHTYAYAG